MCVYLIHVNIHKDRFSVAYIHVKESMYLSWFLILRILRISH